MTGRATLGLFLVRAAAFGLLFAGEEWVGAAILVTALAVEWHVSHRGLPRLPWEDRLFLVAVGGIAVLAGAALCAAVITVGMAIYSLFADGAPEFVTWVVIAWACAAFAKLAVAVGNRMLTWRGRELGTAGRVPRRIRSGGWQA